MKRLILVSCLAASLLLAACGQSSSDKAKSQVCSARADIQKQVKSLKSLTPATATTSGIKDSLTAIRDDLGKIADAQGKLNSDRKKQIQAANDKFVSDFKSVAQDLGTNISISSAKQKLSASAQQLATSYQSTLGQIDCS